MQREAKTEHERDLIRERIDSRRGWGSYVEAMTKVRHSVVAEADEFLTDLHARLAQALARNRTGR
jgi:hypothetical protein